MLNNSKAICISDHLCTLIRNICSKSYGTNNYDLIVRETDPLYKGDFSLLLFPLLDKIQQNKEVLGHEIGSSVLSQCDYVIEYNIVGGFLNFVLSHKKWLEILQCISGDDFLIYDKIDKLIIIEFSSPNTNKPLHLGHLRNIFIGDSLALLLEYVGYTVKKLCVVNDRGIHICKSMLAYQLEGNNSSPESFKMKGDKFVGYYYVLFETLHKKEVFDLKKQGFTDQEIKQKSHLAFQASELLKKWEEGDKNVRDLWHKMNSWVYEGFEATYNELQVKFDKTYYESQVYLCGKDIVLEGLKKNFFYKSQDGAICVELYKDEKKVLIRSDGTSVYITQDLGMCDIRYNEFRFYKSIYIVGDEQVYHFKTLFQILKMLSRSYADKLFHLSYGMVDLPNGKMKSREGTVVDADDLIIRVQNLAKDQILKTCKGNHFSSDEFITLSKIVGLAALRYFLLKVNVQKKITFKPDEAIDLLGNTGPFLQYTCTRIGSLLKKCEHKINDLDFNIPLELEEIDLIKILYNFHQEVTKAVNQLAPDIIAKYVYELCKRYNKFYAKYNVLHETDLEKKNIRIQLSQSSLKIITKCLEILKIEIPDRM